MFFLSLSYVMNGVLAFSSKLLSIFITLKQDTPLNILLARVSFVICDYGDMGFSQNTLMGSTISLRGFNYDSFDLVVADIMYFGIMGVTGPDRSS